MWQVPKKAKTELSSLHLRWRAWTFRVLLLAIGFVLLLGARPTYRGFKGWRSRSLAGRAEDALARNDLTNAARHAQAAYLIRPGEPAALRSAARIQSKIGHPNATEFWQALISCGRATQEDRRSYVELCIRKRVLDRARDE